MSVKKRREGCLTYVPESLVDNGYNVIPVNPKTSES
jgi:predicted CoA-binding protein